MQTREWTSQLIEMERKIERIEGVRTSRIVPTPGHQDIDEIHIIAHPGRHPKQVVRDIESLLLVDFGWSIDYRKISLVQISEEDLAATWVKRPRLISVDVTPHQQNSVKVTLMKRNGEEITASYTAKGEETLASVAAQACLQAVKKIVADPPELKLQGMGKTSIAGKEVLVLWVTPSTSPIANDLLGACFVREDESTTAALAVLHAVNRRLFSD